ncbi:hypothetical protein [Anaplasma ovis]|nr:hypothetical protein [Anaplasma ovis]
MFIEKTAPTPSELNMVLTLAIGVPATFVGAAPVLVPLLSVAIG